MVLVIKEREEKQAISEACKQQLSTAEAEVRHTVHDITRVLGKLFAKQFFRGCRCELLFVKN